ncbi:MAG TPA: tetratricopeptide repeat protein [Thermoanaerobaculia bacterium]|nr:tetratricopeptide repeat protein [Thermoanaerobaculia bacterium]
MSQGLIVRCPACGSRLRLQPGRELPDRFKVRCSACSKPFLVRRKDERGAADSPLERTLTGERVGGPGDDQQTHLHSAGNLTATPPAAPRPPPSASALGSIGAAVASAAAPGSSKGQTFVPGELVAGRYRIERFIAKGGMGEVYAAFDTALNDHVALKTVRPDVAADELALERFKREIHLARQVTHRNVCRIHDLGAYRSDSPLAALYPRGEILFVTMELLRGESLAERLARRGPMIEEDALPLVKQMVAALDAAHAAGIVHRDFKCANVILEPAGPDEVRAVVTDFGLARGGHTDSGATLTVAGAVMGSPAYMAPEQVDGSTTTAAVDIYALGVVIFEMVTGRLPFRGESPLSTAIKRLTEAPPRPSSLKPGLEPRWDETILRCLQRKPADRFVKAGDVVAALDPSPIAAALGTSRLTRRRLWLAVAAGFLVALALVANYTVWRQRAASEEGHLEAPAAARPAVAVLGLKNVTGDQQLAWLSTGLPEMLASELSAGNAVRLIPGENVARAQLELGLKPGDSWGNDTLEKVRRNLGSDYVVSGGYTAIGTGPGAQLRLDLRLQDTVTAGNSTAVAVAGPREAIFQLVSQAGTKLRDALHIAAGGAKWTTTNPEAARLYAQGIERLRGFDARGASDLLQQAVAADPHDPRAFSALASALAALGYVERARDAARQAVELSAPLEENERQEVRAQYLEVAGDWPGAVRAWEDLWRRYPDNLEYGLKLSQALTAAGDPARALEVAGVLRRLPSAAADDVRIYFAVASAAGAAGQSRQQQEAAAKAAQVAESQGARLLRARALLYQGWALRNLGDAERAQGVTAEAEGLFQQAGDPSGVAKARVQRASLLYDQGDLDTARRSFEKALATYRQLGDKGNEAQALNNLALVLKQQGDVQAALGLYERSRALSRETGNRVGVASAENNIGAIDLKRGDLSGALAAFGRSLDLAREVHDKSQEANALYNSAVTLRKLGRLADAEARHRQALDLRRQIGQRIGEAASLTDLAAVQWDRGDLKGASASYAEALNLAKKTGNRRFEAYALAGLGQVRLEAGELDAADQLNRQALQLRQELGEQSTVAESQLSLAIVALEQGRTADAAQLAHTAEQRFANEGAADLVAWARAVQARALLFLDRQPEARQMVALALERASKSEDLRIRCEVQLAWARVTAGGGGVDAADRLAGETAAAADKAGLVPLRLEALLLQGQLAREAGQEARGTQLVAAVREQAQRSGLGLITKKASL